jgi:Fe-S cluster assembly ATP-binding protein
MLQLAVLEPDLAILDETDSGLDIDALRTVAAAVLVLKTHKPSMAILCITHYQRLLTYLPPDGVAVMKDGRIVHRGFAEVAAAIERDGYGAF